MSRKINVRSPFYLFYNDPLEPVYSYWLLQKCGTGSDTAFVRSTFTGFMNTNDSNSDLNASGYHLTENGVTTVYWVRRAATQSEWEQNSGTLDSFDVGNPSCNLCGCDENATTTTTTTSTTTAAPTTTTTTEAPTTTTTTEAPTTTTTTSTTTEAPTTTTSTTTAAPTTTTTTAAPTTTTTTAAPTTTTTSTTTTSTTTQAPTTTTTSTTTQAPTTTTQATTTTTTAAPTTTTTTAAPSCMSYELYANSGTATFSGIDCNGTSRTWTVPNGDSIGVCAQENSITQSGGGLISPGTDSCTDGQPTTTTTTTAAPTTTTTTAAPTTTTTTAAPTTTTTTTTTAAPTTTTTTAAPTTTTTTTGAPSTCHFVFVPDSQTTNNYGLSYYNGSTTLIYLYQLMGTTTVYQGVSGTVFGVCSQTTPLWYDYYQMAAVTDPSGVKRPPNGGSCVSNGNCTYSAPATTTQAPTTTTTQAPTTTTTTTAAPTTTTTTTTAAPTTTTTTAAPTTTTTTTAGPSCTEWEVSNEADDPYGFDAEYSYTDCSGTVQTGYLAFGQTVYVCAQSVMSVHPDITYYDTGTSC